MDEQFHASATGNSPTLPLSTGQRQIAYLHLLQISKTIQPFQTSFHAFLYSCFRLFTTPYQTLPSMASQDVDVGEAELQEVSPYTQALAKRVLRKIDMRILVIMFITYNLNFMDKTILSSAAVFGLTDDNHLVGTQYSWVGSIFYFGYLAFEYPTTILIQKLPVGKYLAGVCLIWGTIVACTAACTSFGGLATCRFLLGVAVCFLLERTKLLY